MSPTDSAPPDPAPPDRPLLDPAASDHAPIAHSPVDRTPETPAFPPRPGHGATPPAAVRGRLLWARGFTAAGDQAWEMALPLAIAALYPRNVQLVAGIWLVLRVAQALLVQRLMAMIDRWSPISVLRVGVLGQTAGVAATWASLAVMVAVRIGGGDERLLWPLLAVAQTTTALCASLMDVAVAQSWLPRLFAVSDLPRTNVRLRQIDLGAEVVMPVVAGAVLAAADAPLIGLGVIAALNFTSFIPEYRLLRPLVAGLQRPPVAATERFDLAARWRLWRAQPIFGSMLAYACLWSTILTPHGAVLTAWLRGVGGLGDAELGLFRGLGAAGGVFGAQLHHLVRRRFSVVATSRGFVAFQALVIVLGTLALGLGWLPGLLVGVVLSRVGLFGFAVGEVEIRQRGVAEEVRGRVSGLAGSINQASTVFVLLLAAGLPGDDNLLALSTGSAIAVLIGAVQFIRWSRTPAAHALAQREL